MKLRVKFTDRKKSTKYYPLDLGNDEQKYGQLQSAIVTIMANDLHLSGVPFYLSLNYGKDAFRADENAGLKDLGLVSGDVVTVVIDKDIPRIKPCCPASDHDGPLTLGFGTYKSSPVPMASHTENRIRDIHEIVLCHESIPGAIPSNLERSYKAEHILCIQDAVILAINTLMEEAGFNKADSESGHPPLIPYWKSREVYKLDYCLRICPSARCQLVCVVFPDRQLFINGVMLDGPSQYSVVTLKINCEKYVDCRQIICENCEPGNVYRNLPELSQHFKDAIAGPLQKIIMTDARIPVKYDLLTLPTEVRLIILRYLTFRDLLRLSETCSNLRQISNEDSLWKKLVNSDFEKKSVVLQNFKEKKKPEETWKSLYIAVHKVVEKKKNQFRRAATSYVGMPLCIPPYPIVVPEFGYPPIVLDGRRNIYNPNRHIILPVRRSWDTHSIVNFNYGYLPRLE